MHDSIKVCSCKHNAQDKALDWNKTSPHPHGAYGINFLLYLLIAYLIMLLVTRTIWHQMVLQVANNDLEKDIG